MCCATCWAVQAGLLSTGCMVWHALCPELRMAEMGCARRLKVIMMEKICRQWMCSGQPRAAENTPAAQADPGCAAHWAHLDAVAGHPGHEAHEGNVLDRSRGARVQHLQAGRPALISLLRCLGALAAAPLHQPGWLVRSAFGGPHAAHLLLPGQRPGILAALR